MYEYRNLLRTRASEYLFGGSQNDYVRQGIDPVRDRIESKLPPRYDLLPNVVFTNLDSGLSPRYRCLIATSQAINTEDASEILIGIAPIACALSDDGSRRIKADFALLKNNYDIELSREEACGILPQDGKDVECLLVLVCAKGQLSLANIDQAVTLVTPGLIDGIWFVRLPD